MSVNLKAREWIHLTTGGTADFDRLRGDSPEFRQTLQAVPPRAIFTISSPAEAARLIGKGAAVEFTPEPGGKLAAILAATSAAFTPGEAAEAGIPHVRVWHAVHDEADRLRLAPAALGFGQPATDACFPDLAAIRAHWSRRPKSIPVFIFEERAGIRAHAWLGGSLLEISRS